MKMLSVPIRPKIQKIVNLTYRVGIDLIFDDDMVILGSNEGLGLKDDKIQASIDYMLDSEKTGKIQYLKHKMVDDLYFVRASGSTPSELKNRADFVTKYLASYPTWVTYEFARREKFGLLPGDLTRIYIDFMSSNISDTTRYKNIFETLLDEFGGVTIDEATYLPCFKYNDVYQYNHSQEENRKLWTSHQKFNLFLFLKTNDIPVLTELAGLSTLKNHLSEAKEFHPMLKTVRKRLMNYISPDADMYTELVVTMPQCNIKEETTVFEIINRCLYDLLGFRKLGDMIDSSPHPARNVRAISAVITLQELKKYLKELA